MAKDQPGTLKRVINGISYNTETSMKVAGTTFNAYDADPYGLTRDELFKTRYGAYFILSHLGWDFEEPLKIIPMSLMRQNIGLKRTCRPGPISSSSSLVASPKWVRMKAASRFGCP